MIIIKEEITSQPTIFNELIIGPEETFSYKFSIAEDVDIRYDIISDHQDWAGIMWFSHTPGGSHINKNLPFTGRTDLTIRQKNLILEIWKFGTFSYNLLTINPIFDYYLNLKNQESDVNMFILHFGSNQPIIV